MLSTKLKEAASNSADATLYVDDVFSTWLYTGNGSTQTITNGIDLAGKGGLVWTKSRSAATDHKLTDTVRGATKALISSTTAVETTDTTGLTAFNSTGFSLGASSVYNTNAATYVSWTFRKAAKFFDVVTYTGDSNNSRMLNHNLGVTPGMIICKRLNSTSNWFTWHKAAAITDSVTGFQLNSTDAPNTTGYNTSADMTATQFRPAAIFDSGYVEPNVSGGTYVAYLFAHDTSSTGIIQCGSYTGNGSATGPVVTLGWEPQYLMIKNATGTGNWQVIDSMRGMPVGSADATLQANLGNAESGVEYLSPTATGFQITSTSTEVNTSGSTYIYMAIRRPNKPPTTGTQVYNAIARTGTGAVATVTGVGFSPDLVMSANRSSAGYGNLIQSKLNGTSIVKHPFDNSDTTSTVAVTSFNMDGYSLGTDSGASGTGEINKSGDTFINWLLKRYVGVFDQICWVGTNITTKRLAHNLGVIPELALMKASNPQWWFVYHKDLGISKYLYLNQPNAVATFNVFGTLAPTATDIGFNEQAQDTNTTTLGTNTGTMYLFATLAGISKVGSYTGNGTSQNINCGFAAGARFFLVKATSTTGSWWVWDSARGITAGNDPALQLNSTAAEITTADAVDPYSPGITVNQEATCSINASGVSYVYLAIS